MILLLCFLGLFLIKVVGGGSVGKHLQLHVVVKSYFSLTFFYHLIKKWTSQGQVREHPAVHKECIWSHWVNNSCAGNRCLPMIEISYKSLLWHGAASLARVTTYSEEFWLSSMLIPSVGWGKIRSHNFYFCKGFLLQTWHYFNSSRLTACYEAFWLNWLLIIALARG